MFKHTYLTAILLILSPVWTAEAVDHEFREYAVKSAFILNIMKFIEWPEAWLSLPSLDLCILGENPFGKDADGLQGKVVKEKTIQLRPIKKVGEDKNCRIVFIGSSEKERLGQILSSFEGKDVLTIGDTPGYAEQGVLVNFFEEDSKVRFQINLAAVNKTRLKFDSRILKIAKVISDTRD